LSEAWLLPTTRPAVVYRGGGTLEAAKRPEVVDPACRKPTTWSLSFIAIVELLEEPGRVPRSTISRHSPDASSVLRASS
jgi:hypothetical protein